MRVVVMDDASITSRPDDAAVVRRIKVFGVTPPFWLWFESSAESQCRRERAMHLRLAARGDGSNSTLVHLVVTQAAHIGGMSRRRGEALCRPSGSLPNLEALDRQSLVGRSCCERCVELMQRVRLHQHIELPPSLGMTAGELIKQMQVAREAASGSTRPRKPIRSILKE